MLTARLDDGRHFPEGPRCCQAAIVKKIVKRLWKICEVPHFCFFFGCCASREALHEEDKKARQGFAQASRAVEMDVLRGSANAAANSQQRRFSSIFLPFAVSVDRTPPRAGGRSSRRRPGAPQTLVRRSVEQHLPPTARPLLLQR
jgi:hypothetical protein